MGHKNLVFNKEVNGLRSLAVLFVLLYHAQFTLDNRVLFLGGYLGVDIFFVISGYVISRILITKIHLEKSFSITTFYIKRARRILPVYLFVILIVLILSYFYLLKSDFVELVNSTIHSIFFTSNFYFFYDSLNYMSQSALLKPLLHTWSLAVEVQIYLIFPLLLLIFKNYIKQKMLFFFFTLFLISYIFSGIISQSNMSISFYNPFFRLWEFLLGSICAYRELFCKKNYNRIFFSITKIIGFILIFFSLFFFNKETTHPSFITIIPLIGVCLIIETSDKIENMSIFLSNKFTTFIGNISFSIYLIHYPLFAFYYYNNTIYTNFEKILLIFFIVALSVISFFLIENKFRDRLKISDLIYKKYIYFIYVIIIFIILFSFSNFFKFQKNGESLINKYLDKKSYQIESAKYEVNFDYSIKKDNRKSMLIVGNSHAEDLLKILILSKYDRKYRINLTSPKKRFKDFNYQITCLYDLLKYNNSICENFDTKLDVINQYNDADIILLATKWARPYEIQILPELLEIISRDKKKIIVISNTPQSIYFGKRKLNRFDYFLFKYKRFPNKDELLNIETNFYNDYRKNIEPINNKLRDIVKNSNSKNISYLDRADYMCDKFSKRCSIFFPDTRTKVIFDSAHITLSGAKVLAQRINEINWLN
jgi:peptidoglycan/LPS O-acetylase OafA/YrhL